MISNLFKLAAEKARDAAEEYFKLQNVDMALKTLKAAKDFNPDLPYVDDYFTAYKVHELAARKSTWYELLDITDPEVDTSVIKKQYNRLAPMLHPDKNPSVAADGASKLIKTALDVLTNSEKRKAYDAGFTSMEANVDANWSWPPAPDDQKFSRDYESHKATNASSGLRRTNPPRENNSSRKRYGQRYNKRSIWY